MIRANREVIPDRKLFQLLYNHRLSSGIKVSPNFGLDYETVLNEFMENVMHSFARLQAIYIDQIDLLESRLDQITNYCARLHAILKQKKPQKNLYSFANSPISKTNKQTPQSAQKPSHKQCTNFSPSLSTQPQSKKKPNQFESTTKKLDRISPYFEQKLGSLFDEITQLRLHIDRAHPHLGHFAHLGHSAQLGHSDQYLPFKYSLFSQVQEIPALPSVARRLDSLREYWDHDQEKSQDVVMIKSQLEKCKAIIKQYQKQQNMLQIKLNKYKTTLNDVLAWLNNIKNVQLKKYLPCQACNIKQIVYQYLNTKSSIKTSTQPIRDQQKSDRDSLLVQDDDNFEVRNSEKKSNFKNLSTENRRKISLKSQPHSEGYYESLLEGEDNRIEGNWGMRGWGTGLSKENLEHQQNVNEGSGNQNIFRQSAYYQGQSKHSSAQNDDSD